MKYLRNLVVYIFVFFLSLLVFLIPTGLMKYFSLPISRFIYRTFGRERKRSFENIHMILDLDKDEALSINKEVFAQTTMTLFEFLSFPILTRKRIEKMIDFSELNRLKKVLERSSKGLIIVTAHLGNWELLVAALAQKGLKVNAIANEQKSPFIEYIMSRYREKQGYNIISNKGMSLRKAFQVLKKGELLIILSDHHGGDDGIALDFLGHETSCPVGPAVFAQRLEVPILPVFLIRQDYASHYLSVGDEIRISKPEDEENLQQIKDITEDINRIIEGYIRSYPQQWLWMNNRWKELSSKEE